MILPNQNYETDLILSRNAATFRKSQEEILVEDNPSKWSERQIELDFDFHPGYYDVICARGNKAWNHPGNKFFRALVCDFSFHYNPYPLFHSLRSLAHSPSSWLNKQS